MQVLTIPQGDGVRYVALSNSDASVVANDPAMLDHVDAMAILDVDRNGRATWERPFGCEDTAAGREAIRAHRRH